MYVTSKKLCPVGQLPKGLLRVLLKICDFARGSEMGLHRMITSASCADSYYQLLTRNCIPRFFLSVSIVLGLCSHGVQ